MESVRQGNQDYMRKDTLTVDQRVRLMRAKKEQVGPCDGQEKQQGTAQVQ